VFYAAAVISGALLREARRRAGLSQAELGDRVGRAQTQIARWERGAVQPSLETLRRLIHACDLELSVGLATRDDSYAADAAERLALTPASRLERAISAANAVRSLRPRIDDDVAAHPPFDPVPVLAALEAGSVPFVLIGSIAGTLRGSPLLPVDGTVALVPHAEKETLDRLETALRSMGAARSSSDALCWRSRVGDVAIDLCPSGTNGYADLRRDATLLEAAADLHVLVASLPDLVRIAEAATEPEQHARVVALRATLEVAETDAELPLATDG
jgi:transcriptional regulator with XRE-family HTH domain